MRKIILAIAAVLGLLFVTANPANAALSWSSPWDKFDQLDCGSAPQTGHLSGNKGTGSDTDRFAIQMDLNDAGSGAPHNWNYRLIHDGSTSVSTSDTGSFTDNKTAVNFSGVQDTFTFKVDNNSGTIHCQAQINFG